MKLQYHTCFKNELLQQKISTLLQKIVDAEEKTNENNVDSQEQISKLLPKFSKHEFHQ
jgi:hypothetical protein